MNILFITKEFSHKSLNKTGGIGRFYSEISEELVSKNHKVFVLGYNSIKFNSTENGISVYFFKKINFNSSLILLSFFVNRFLLIIHFLLFINRNKNKIDVIEMDDPITSYFISFFYKKIPKVIRQHGMPSILSVMYGNKINKFYYFFEKRALIRCQGVIAVSSFAKDMTLSLYEVDIEVDIVYNGVSDINYFDVSKRKSTRILLYVAALSENKGYFNLVEVFNKIISMGVIADLMVIGRQDEFQFEDLKFSEEAKSKVSYIGVLDYENLIDYYEKSNLFLNFSHGETFGYTTVEAMSYRLPVIISNIGVANEVVNTGINGYVIDENDLEEVVGCVEKILDDDQLQFDFGIKSADIVREKFSREQMAINTLRVYEKLIITESVK